MTTSKMLATASRMIDLAAVEPRFWSKVKRTEDGCWEWQGARAPSGYGHISAGRGVCLMAHRVAYVLSGRVIPDDLQLDHLCRNPPCVRPDHLEPVTPAENSRRAALVRTHCIRGHELPTFPKSGRRKCQPCRTQRQRERRRAAIDTLDGIDRNRLPGLIAAGEKYLGGVTS